MLVPGSADNWIHLATCFTTCEEATFSGHMVSLCACPTSLGLSHVYNELFSLAPPCSFYICDALGCKEEGGECDWLLGVPFEDVQNYFPRAVVAGVLLQYDASVKMGALDHTLVAGDRLILLASEYRQTTPLASPNPVKRVKGDKGLCNLPKSVDKLGAKDSAGPSRGEGFSVGKNGGVVVLGSNERSSKTIKEIAALVPDATISHEPQDYMNPAALQVAGVLSAQCVVVLSDSNTASNVDHSSDAELLGIVETLAALPWPEDARVC
jgi:hypothetical protein